MSESDDVLELVYDGDCPFCTRFVELYRIRKNVGRVELVDARTRPDLVARFSSAGMNINDGMVATWGGRSYYGADCVNLLSLLSADKGAFAAMNRVLFSNRRVAKVIYPGLVMGRKVLLRLLGRPLINTAPS